MRSYRDLSIRHKLYVIIMFTSGVGLLFASAAFLTYDLIAFRRAMTRDLSTLAEIVGQDSTAALTFNDSHSATQILSALKAKPNIICACTYASDGKLLAVYIREKATQAMNLPRPQPSGSAFRKGRLDLFREILLDGQVVGTVYLASDLHEMYARLERYAGIVLVIAAVSFLVILPLASKFQQGISKPILHLAETAKVVSTERNYSVRAVPSSQDELGQLTVGFNEMLAQIQDQDQSLQRHREHLEEKVAARTEDLSRANRELRTEILERQRAEEALGESEAKYRVLIETTGTGYVIVDTEGRVIDANAEYVRLTGHGALTEILGHAVAEWTAPHDLARTTQAFKECLKQGLVRNFETEHVNGAGQCIPVEVNATTVPGEEGARMVALCRDITRRKQAEQARAVLASIVESSEDAIVAHTRDGKIASWNRGAEVLYGYRPEEVIGKPVSMLVAPERVEDWRQNLAVLERGERLSRLEGVGVKKDGTKVEISVSISPIVDDAGRVTGSAAIISDITERKQAERELLMAKDAAEAASRAKSEFLANMSHEIRTPMNGIIGMTDLALDTDLRPEQREYLNMVKTSAHSLLRLINDILDFSKIEAGKLELDQVEFNLRDSLGDTLKGLALRAHQKGLELVGDVSAEVPEALRGDPTRLRQILVNLVGNAIKFTERGEVFVKVEREAQTEPSVDGLTLRFTVKDTGIGIPAEKQQKIFEPFTQADGSMTRKYGGTGLGLAIASQLVKAMGGRIWADSRPGEGSTFHFTVVLGLCAKPPESAQRAEVATLEGLPVLAVDDNATNRRILEEILIRWRMLPVLAEGGWTALAALERACDAGKPFPLILIDAQMPDMDGFALAERIRQNPRLVGASIMMLTSAGRPGDAARCRALGVAAYLIKPIRQAELLEAILLALGPPAGGAGKAPGPPLITRHSLREAKRKLRILLAEDNAVNRELVVRWLERWGCAVVTAHNGREVLAALEESSRQSAGSFDLILMDVQMPDMDGFEATAVIRSREKNTGQHLPIVALTAHAMKGDRERCLAAGMDAYLAKPLEPSELLDTLERLTSAFPQGASMAPEEEPAVFDSAEVLARVDGDAELLGELAGLFLKESPKLLSAVQEAVERGDARGLERAAHALKGSAGNFAARATMEAAWQLELMGCTGDLTRANQACVTLEAEMQRLQGALENLRRKVVA
jgi:PAS domain S-box-containing protein